MSYKIVVLHYKSVTQRQKPYVTDTEAVKKFQKKYAPKAGQDFQIIRTWPPATDMNDKDARQRRYERLIKGSDDFPPVSAEEAREIMSRKRPRGTRAKLPLEQNDSDSDALEQSRVMAQQAAAAKKRIWDKPVPDPTHQQIPPEKLPDPWLFDSESLLKELDRCRELVAQIPSPTHRAYFAINVAIDALWTLRQTLRHLLGIHVAMQRDFVKKHSPLATQASEAQTVLDRKIREIRA